MPQSESFKSSRQNAPASEFTPRKEPSPLDKLGTAVGDTLRDIRTANRMAKSKFDGDTALMHVARGGVTTLVGVGLEKALTETVDRAFRGETELIQKPWLKLGEDTKKLLEKVKKDDYRLYYFITHASKDLVVGMMYNGLAFFSRPMLPSAEGKHLLWSVAGDAADAWLTKGIEDDVKIRNAEDKRFSIADDIQATTNAKEEARKLHTSEGRKKVIAANRRLKDLQADYKAVVTPPDTRLGWQTTMREYLGFANPATLLGADMIVSGGATLVQNFRKVREVRKEKGGLRGREVYVQSGYRQHDRRPSYNKGQGNREKVYYGGSRWGNKAQEEEDRAKLM